MKFKNTYDLLVYLVSNERLEGFEVRFMNGQYGFGITINQYGLEDSLIKYLIEKFDDWLTERIESNRGEIIIDGTFRFRFNDKDELVLDSDTKFNYSHMHWNTQNERLNEELNDALKNLLTSITNENIEDIEIDIAADVIDSYKPEIRIFKLTKKSTEEDFPVEKEKVVSLLSNFDYRAASGFFNNVTGMRISTWDAQEHVFEFTELSKVEGIEIKNHFSRNEVKEELPFEVGYLKTDKPELRRLKEYCGTNDRVCPMPIYWAQFYDILKNKTYTFDGRHKPKRPAILSGWWVTPPEMKRKILFNQLEWADEQGQLEEVKVFLHSLGEEDWFYSDI